MSFQISVGSSIFSSNRIFCIGRNYVDHVEELNNEIPNRPVIFMKPNSCLVPSGEKIKYPTHGYELQHEAEIVVIIGNDGKSTTIDEADSFVAGISIGFDLTLRDLQSNLKSQGLPWEIAKAFDQSSPIGNFVPYDQSFNLKDISFECRVNGEQRQTGNSSQMIFPIDSLIMELCKIWKLEKGDLIYTGTPKGVGSVNRGDLLEIESQTTGNFSWQII